MENGFEQCGEGISAGDTGSACAVPLKVLVVDDSVVIRMMVAGVLKKAPGIVVVGVARDGVEALRKMAELQPDVVTLDVEMPEMNGMQALKLIRERHPRVKVVMLSGLTERGAATTIDALMAGANDYVAKPRGGDSGARSLEETGRELADKIRCLFNRGGDTGKNTVPASSPAHGSSNLSQILRSAKGMAPQMLTIGVSTGGPSALAEIMPNLPKDFPLPITIVQHMPPSFTTMLAERLRRVSRIEVVEGQDGMPVLPGRAILAPGDFHMRVSAAKSGAVVRLSREELENSCRPAVDVLFRSVAQVYGARSIGLVLTGMGQDGLVGSRALKGVGAAVLAQDRASSVVWGMPRAIVEANLADKVLSLGDMVSEVLRRVA